MTVLGAPWLWTRGVRFRPPNSIFLNVRMRAAKGKRNRSEWCEVVVGGGGVSARAGLGSFLLRDVEQIFFH